MKNRFSLIIILSTTAPLSAMMERVKAAANSCHQRSAAHCDQCCNTAIKECTEFSKSIDCCKVAAAGCAAKLAFDCLYPRNFQIPLQPPEDDPATSARHHLASAITAIREMQ